MLKQPYMNYYFNKIYHILFVVKQYWKLKEAVTHSSWKLGQSIYLEVVRQEKEALGNMLQQLNFYLAKL